MLGALCVHALEDALLADDVCAGPDCSLSLLQSQTRATSETSLNETAAWQGARETSNTCLWSKCDVNLGPTDCYHFRCVCKADHVWNPRLKQCVHRYTPAGREVISPQDTGATCYFKDCDQKFTTCSDDNKCLCIPGFVYMAGQGGYGGCQRNPSLFPPNIQWSAADDAHRWEQSHPPPQPNVQPVPAPPPTVAAESSCARHSQCAGLAGNCCPNDLGLSLSCCR